MIPTREIFWNVGHLQMTVYILAGIALTITVWGIIRHVMRWRLGRSRGRFDQVGKRIGYLFRFVLGQARILEEAYPGIMHLFLFWGFAILFLGTLTIAFQEDFLAPLFHKEILRGDFYLLYSLIVDVFGLLAVVGILMALYRRYIIRPGRLDNKPSDLILLGLILFVLLTGFCVEGLRISATRPPWAAWSPGGWLVAQLFGGVAPAEESQRELHKVFWWIHLFGSLGLFVYFPFSNLFHVISSSLNALFRSLEARGSLPSVEFKKALPLGVERMRDLTWKGLLDLDACTRCGRCQDSCPAYLSGKPLNPKKVIQDLKSFMWHSGECPPLAGGAVSGDEIWSCTTCHACVEVCPVFVEHVEKIVGLRRYLVMEKAHFPGEIKRLFRNLEIYGDTHGKGVSLRTDWLCGLPMGKVHEDLNSDVLFWVGCEGSFHDRNREVSRAILQTLERAGVRVGILGKGEVCCGDPARRLGNEYLFRELARQNIAMLNRRGVRKIVTYCPHCMNTLKNEYPQLGGRFEVLHYSEYFLQLLRERRLMIRRPVEVQITYQDPCYLGRVNGIYMAPRELVRMIPGLKLREMVRSRKHSFCCGGGGGGMWIHENIGRRINQVRSEEALEMDVDVVGTACPYCLTMLEDGLKNLEGEKRISVLDLSEIIHRAIQ